MLSRLRPRLARFRSISWTLIEYIPLAAGAVLAATHPAVADSISAGTLGADLTSPLTQICHNVMVPVIGAVAGLGGAVGVVGHLRDPEHKEFFDKMIGYGSVGTLGSIMVWNMPGLINGLTSGITGGQ